MSKFLLIALGLELLLAINLQRAYSHVSLKELKTRARAGDKTPAGLIKAVGYGSSLQVLLWTWITLAGASFFVWVSRYMDLWAAFSVSAILIAISFVWLPSSSVSSVTKYIAAKLAPVFAFVLNYLHPLTDQLVNLIKQFKSTYNHTGLYDKYDLLDLFDQQKLQADSRIEKTDLEIAKNVLKSGNDNINQLMQPWRKVKTVSPDDALGPVLMDELHSSGQSNFPVYDKIQKAVVGTLFLSDLLKTKSGGTVRSVMQPEVHYLHEDQTLGDALQAVLKTHQHLFIVVNNNKDYVGAISSDNIFESIIGKPSLDEFDQYGDLDAVIAKQANQVLEEIPETKTEEEAPEIIDTNEVVEVLAENETDENLETIESQTPEQD